MLTISRRDAAQQDIPHRQDPLMIRIHCNFTPISSATTGVNLTINKDATDQSEVCNSSYHVYDTFRTYKFQETYLLLINMYYQSKLRKLISQQIRAKRNIILNFILI